MFKNKSNYGKLFLAEMCSVEVKKTVNKSGFMTGKTYSMGSDLMIFLEGQMFLWLTQIVLVHL